MRSPLFIRSAILFAGIYAASFAQALAGPMQSVNDNCVAFFKSEEGARYCVTGKGWVFTVSKSLSQNTKVGRLGYDYRTNEYVSHWKRAGDWGFITDYSCKASYNSFDCTTGVSQTSYSRYSPEQERIAEQRKKDKTPKPTSSTQSGGSWEAGSTVHPQIKARRAATRVACEMATNAVGRGWTAEQARGFKANIGCQE